MELKAQSLTKGQLIFLTIVTSLSSFMMVLDGTIANVAIPTIAGNLGVSTDQGTWVITAFGAANAISMCMTGILSRRFGEVRLLSTAIVGFVISSLLCGLAQSMTQLIVFRTFQGAVSGSIAPLALTMLLRNYPREKAGMAQALFSMTTVVAPICGPILGGYLTDNYSWNWIFFINVPVGLFTAASIWFMQHKNETKTTKIPFNAISIALLVVAAGSLQIMLDIGKDHDWFSSNMVITLAVVAIASWGVFIIYEWYNDHPVLNVHFFTNRNFTLAIILMCLGYMVFFGSIVLLPLWLQTVMGYTAFLSGIAVAPVGITAILTAPIVGRMVGKVDARYILSWGFFVFAMVGLYRASFYGDTTINQVAIGQLILGLGMISFFAPTQNMVATSVEPEYVSSAISMSSFFRTLCGSFSSSIVMTMWTNRATFHHSRIVDTLHGDNTAYQQLLTTVHHQMSMVELMIQKQAIMMSTSDVFYLTFVVSLLLIPIVWLAKPASK